MRGRAPRQMKIWSTLNLPPHVREIVESPWCQELEKELDSRTETNHGLWRPAGQTRRTDCVQRPVRLGGGRRE